jgi:hypothetical protein
MLLKEGKDIGDFFCGEFLSFCKKKFENNFQKKIDCHNYLQQ